jgi:hypothetical protein
VAENVLPSLIRMTEQFIAWHVTAVFSKHQCAI